MKNTEFRQLQNLFHRALARPAGERDEFLRGACDGDVELRRRVEALLAAHAAGAAFLAESTDLPEFAGLVIDRYRLVEVLGEGGFGVVWRAEQLEPVQREVALKVVKPGMDTREVLRRFETERQSLARMQHANIATVFDAGATAHGRPYFVMESVRGTPLPEYCVTHDLGVRARLELFAQVCSAIQHAHQKGVIHRDLKPSNVLVTEAGGDRACKVIDFGIAKALEDSSGGATRHTAGFGLGTPGYMAPEQAAPGSTDVDTRADVYSLGALLYEVLTGAAPFDGAAIRRRAMLDPQLAARDADPPRPSARVRALRGDLDWITMKALEVDRDRRYDTVNELQDDVLRFLGGEPVRAGPPSRAYRLRKFVRRHRAGIVVSALVVAALSITSIVAIQGWVAARAEARRAVAISDLLVEMLGSAHPNAPGAPELTVRELVDGFDAHLDGALPDAPAAEAAIRDTIARVYLGLGRPERAMAHAERALALHRELFGSTDLHTAGSLARVGGAAFASGDLDRAEREFTQALTMRRDALGAEHPAVAELLGGLGDIAAGRGELERAVELHSDALAMRRRTLVAPHREIAESLNDLGAIHLRRGDPAAAAPLCREALLMISAVVGENHPSTWIARSNLASVLLEIDDPKAAEHELRAVLAAMRRHVGSPHPNLAMALENLSVALAASGEFEAAALHLEEAVAIWRALRGDEDPNVTAGQHHLERLRAAAGRR